jgi:hypothetical protein
MIVRFSLMSAGSSTLQSHSLGEVGCRLREQFECLAGPRTSVDKLIAAVR